MIRFIRAAAVAGFVMLSAPFAHGGDKTVMHCFAWTPIQEATPEDWSAFYKASDALPHKIKGIRRVWYGKLVDPLSQAQLVKTDSDAFRKYQAGETVSSNVRRAAREFGMCMEMSSAAALKAYDTDPYHKIWTEAYAKIRVDGTTTFNILGQ